jgi:hypothetical protein
MKISIERLKQIIKEELASEDHQEYQRMGAENEATELLQIYNDFLDTIREDVTWHSMVTDLDEKIRYKIQEIEEKLNEPTK